MPENVLLHFPIVDLVCLQRSVREHTRRVSRFIHEHNEYLNKCKLLTSDKGLTTFPLYLTKVPSQLTCSENILLSENDIFCAAIEDKFIENNRTVSSDIIGGKSDSVISSVKLFELNSLYRGSDLGWRNSEKEFGNLTTISCPIRFPSEEKPIFFPVPGFETFGASPKSLNHDVENIEKKYSEFLCELMNDIQKMESIPTSVIPSVKDDEVEVKIETNNSYEPMDEDDDDCVFLEEKKGKIIETITIEEEAEDMEVQVEQSANQDSASSTFLITTVEEESRESRVPSVDLSPPFLIPDPPSVSPEIMGPDSPPPPLIFPEMDPPLWENSGPSPVTYSDDAQPPILSREDQDPLEADTTVLISDESQPPLITSEVLTPMLPNNETPEPPSSTSTSSVAVDSSAPESSREPVIFRNSDTNFITPSVGNCVRNNSTQESAAVSIVRQNLTRNTTFPRRSSVEMNDTMITPKKTTDITKIKGWKKKQFLVEKYCLEDFFSSPNPSDMEVPTTSSGQQENERQVLLNGDNEGTNTVDETPENTFVCDNLDKFLEGEADLNINYEVPRLYAELGISLTKDAVLSRPNMTEEELKRFEGKYRVPIELKDNSNKLVKSGRVGRRGVKRKLTHRQHSSKARKLEANGREKSTVNSRGKKAPGKLCPSPKSAQTEKSSSGLVESTDLNGQAFEGPGTNKVLGLVLYPGPNAPLPKKVKRHLDNIRSDRIVIDRNWANFAASALDVPKKNWNMRMILPIQYNIKNLSQPEETTAVPAVVNEVMTDLVDTARKKPSRKTLKKSHTQDVSLVESQMSEGRNRKPGRPKKITKNRQRTVMETDIQDSKAKNCKVLLSHAKNPSRLICIEHKRSNCKRCGTENVVRVKSKYQSNRGVESPELFVMSTPLLPDTDVYSLLAQKVRTSQWNNLAITNIDILKSIVPNTLELIKCSLVRESFLNGHIFIWYLSPHPSLQNKLRALLTFSKTSPEPYAILLNPHTINDEVAVPKVIQDIITKKGNDDENEYAIMYCSQNVWEIHGSLRYATSNSNSNSKIFGQDCLKREEVFTPTYPPELERISEAGTKIIKEPAVRWWVVDLTQKFTSIVSNLESRINTMTRKSIFNKIKTRFYGFLTLNKTSNRVLWVHVFPKILPYVLIGPYKLSEPHGLILKQGLKPVPFSYNSTLCTSPNFPLKKFLNSVITQVEEQDRELKALWLCDRQQVDKTCYVEMFTSVRENNFSMSEYDLDVEHGYSLKSLINSPPLKELKRTLDDATPRADVYIYFDIPELGYVKAQLLPDDVLVLKNPMTQETFTTPLFGFGNWINGFLKTKIQFVPSDLKLNWHLTKHFEELRGRGPFPARYLEGFYMIYEEFPGHDAKLVQLRIGAKYLRKNTFLNYKRVGELVELKKLEYFAYGFSKDTTNTRMILEKAVRVIKNLEAMSHELNDVRNELRFFNMILSSRYERANSSFNGDDNSINEWIFTTNDLGPILNLIEPIVDSGKKRPKRAPRSPSKIFAAMISGDRRTENSKGEGKTKETPTIPTEVTQAAPMKKISARTRVGKRTKTATKNSKQYLLESSFETPAATSRATSAGASSKTPAENRALTTDERIAQILEEYSRQVQKQNSKPTPAENPTQGTVKKSGISYKHYSRIFLGGKTKLSPIKNPNEDEDFSLTFTGYSMAFLKQDSSQSRAAYLPETPAQYSMELLEEDSSQTIARNSSKTLVRNHTETPARIPDQFFVEHTNQSLAENSSGTPTGNPTETFAGYPKKFLLRNSNQSLAENCSETPKQTLAGNPTETPARHSGLTHKEKSRRIPAHIEREYYAQNPNKIVDPSQSLFGNLTETPAEYSSQFLEKDSYQGLTGNSSETPAQLSKQTLAGDPTKTFAGYLHQFLPDHSYQAKAGNSSQTSAGYSQQFLIDHSYLAKAGNPSETPAGICKQTLPGNSSSKMAAESSKQTLIGSPVQTLTGNPQQSQARNLAQMPAEYSKQSPEGKQTPTENSVQTPSGDTAQIPMEKSFLLLKTNPKHTPTENSVQTPSGNTVHTPENNLEHILTVNNEQCVRGNSDQILSHSKQEKKANNCVQTSARNSAQSPGGNSNQNLRVYPAKTREKGLKHTLPGDSVPTAPGSSKQSLAANPQLVQIAYLDPLNSNASSGANNVESGTTPSNLPNEVQLVELGKVRKPPSPKHLTNETELPNTKPGEQTQNKRMVIINPESLRETKKPGNRKRLVILNPEDLRETTGSEEEKGLFILNSDTIRKMKTLEQQGKRVIVLNSDNVRETTTPEKGKRVFVLNSDNVRETTTSEQREDGPICNPETVSETTVPEQPQHMLIYNPESVPKTTVPEQLQHMLICNPESVRETTVPEQLQHVLICNPESVRETTVPEQLQHVLICNPESVRETTVSGQPQHVLICNPESVRNTTVPEQPQHVLMCNPESVPKTTVPEQPQHMLIYNPESVPKTTVPEQPQHMLICNPESVPKTTVPGQPQHVLICNPESVPKTTVPEQPQHVLICNPESVCNTTVPEQPQHVLICNPESVCNTTVPGQPQHVLICNPESVCNTTVPGQPQHVLICNPESVCNTTVPGQPQHMLIYNPESVRKTTAPNQAPNQSQRAVVSNPESVRKTTAPNQAPNQSQRAVVSNPESVRKTRAPNQSQPAVVLNPESVRKTTVPEQPQHVFICNPESVRKTTAPNQAPNQSQRAVVLNPESVRKTTAPNQAPNQSQRAVVLNPESVRKTTAPNQALNQSQRAVVLNPRTVSRTTRPEQSGSVTEINSVSTSQSLRPFHWLNL